MNRFHRLVLAICFLIVGSMSVYAQDDDAFPLTETFEASDGSAGFNYPTGWVINETLPIVTLATNAEVLSVGTPLGRDELRLTILISPQVLVPSVTASMSMSEIFEIATAINDVSTCDPFLPLEIVIVDEIELIVSTQTCSTTDNVFMLRDLGDGNIGIIAGSTLLGEMPDFISTLLRIVTTMWYGERPENFPVPENTEEAIIAYVIFQSVDGTLTFTHPGIWDVSYNLTTRIARLTLPDDLEFTLEVFTEATINSTLDLLQSNLFADELKIDAIEPIEIFEFSGFRVDIGNNDNSVVIIEYLLDIGGEMIVRVNFPLSPDNLTEIESDILELMASVAFNPEADTIDDTGNSNEDEDEDNDSGSSF